MNPFRSTLALLFYIGSRRGGVTIDEAARQFGWDRRSIYRHLTCLENAGVPLIQMDAPPERKGRGGNTQVWKIEPGFLVPAKLLEKFMPHMIETSRGRARPTKLKCPSCDHEGMKCYPHMQRHAIMGEFKAVVEGAYLCPKCQLCIPIRQSLELFSGKEPGP